MSRACIGISGWTYAGWRGTFYAAAALDHWADRVRTWLDGREPDDAARFGPPAPGRRGRDAYIFFDNDAKVRAPLDALGLAARLGSDWKERHEP